MKEYTEMEETFTVSQIEVEDTTEVLDRRKEFMAVLDAERAKGEKLFSALMVTDIAILSSIMLISADAKFLKAITLPKHDESVYEMRGVVSRKKQMMPLLSELVEKYKDA